MAILIAYYSRRGENYCSGTVKSLPKGNTERAAEFIHSAVGGDLFEAETVTPYPESYRACTEQAKAELHDNARPELKAYPDLAGYDTIFLGYPNWWGTMPMCMFTLLERYDLTGKTIVPFCTNEGSGMGSSERDLKWLCAQRLGVQELMPLFCELDEVMITLHTVSRRSPRAGNTATIT